MPWAAERGYIALTVDNRIRWRPEQRRIREACGLRTIFLPGPYASHDKFFQVGWVLTHWLTIDRHAGQANPGDTYVMKMNGEIELLSAAAGRRKRRRRR